MREWAIAGMNRAGRNHSDAPDRIAMLSGYFDDSSDPKRQSYVAVGGLLGHEVEWDRFELLWISATHKLIEPFRSTECECQFGQFSSWEKSDCDKLMAGLVGLILSRPLWAFGAVVPVQDYRSVFPDSGNHDPYLLAVKHALINVAYLASLANERIGCWFEDSKETNGRVAEIYSQLKSVRAWKHRDRLAGIHFVDKRVVAVQAADLYARESYKHFANAGKRPMRKPLVRLHGKMFLHGWTPEALSALAHRGGPDNLSLLANDATVTDMKAPRPTLDTGMVAM